MISIDFKPSLSYLKTIILIIIFLKIKKLCIENLFKLISCLPYKIETVSSRINS